MAIEIPLTREWASRHEASWELAPLLETERGERVQAGFALDLYARIPESLSASEETLVPLWDRLREIAESLVPLLGRDGRIEIEPFDVASRLRAETHFAPELRLRARLFRDPQAFAEGKRDDRARLRPLEGQLAELGLRARHP